MSATLGQARKVLEVISQSGISNERLQLLLETPLLPLLLQADHGRVNLVAYIDVLDLNGLKEARELGIDVSLLRGIRVVAAPFDTDCEFCSPLDNTPATYRFEVIEHSERDLMGSVNTCSKMSCKISAAQELQDWMSESRHQKWLARRSAG